jgi:DNA-binding Xre family transcriptional regulator
MNREDKITTLIKEKYKSIREFSNISGIPNSTIVSMLKNGLGGTSVDTVLLVCKCLNISIEELNDTKNQPQELPLTADISAEELKIIKKYRSLDSRGKKAVCYTLDCEYEQGEKGGTLSSSLQDCEMGNIG